MELRFQEGHGGGVTLGALSPDGRWALTGCTVTPEALLWHVPTGRQVRRLEERQGVLALALGSDGRRAALVSPRNRVSVHAARTGRLIARRGGLGFPAQSVALSPGGGRLAIGDGGGPVHLFRVAAFELEVEWEAHPSFVHALAFSPDARLLATVDHERVRLWRLGTDEPALVAELGAPDGIRSLAFGQGGQVLVAAGADQRRTWRVPDGSWGFFDRLPRFRRIRAPEISPRAVLLSATPDAGLYGTRGGAAEVVTPKGARRLSGAVPVRSLGWDEAAGHLLVCGHDGLVRRWAPAGGVVPAVAAGPRGFEAIDAGGGILVAGGEGGFVRTIRLSDGARLAGPPAAFEPHVDPRDGGWDTVTAVAVSPEAPGTRPGLAAWLVAAGTVVVQELESGRERYRTPEGVFVGGMALRRATGQLFLGLTGGELLEWDLATGRERRRILAHGDVIHRVALSPDGGLLVTADRLGNPACWSTETLQPVPWPSRGPGLEAWRKAVLTGLPVTALGGSSRFAAPARCAVVLRSLSSGRTVGTVWVAEDGEWVLAAPGGRWDASTGAGRYAWWDEGAARHPLRWREGQRVPGLALAILAPGGGG